MPDDDVQTPAERGAARRWSWWRLCVVLLIVAAVVAVALQVVCDG